jgi:hypothetical protein
METGGKWEREAERATEQSAESHGDEREQTGTHEGDPVAGAGSGDSNLADDEDPTTTSTDRPEPA